jgi:hypothetical protein
MASSTGNTNPDGDASSAMAELDQGQFFYNLGTLLRVGNGVETFVEPLEIICLNTTILTGFHLTTHKP